MTETVTSVLIELYDWRFELAAREKNVRATQEDFRAETRRLLNVYGAQKKVAWEAARRVLVEKT